MQGSVQFNSLGENGAAVAFIFQWQDNGTAFTQVLPATDPGSKMITATKPAWTGPVELTVTRLRTPGSAGVQ